MTRLLIACLLAWPCLTSCDQQTAARNAEPREVTNGAEPRIAADRDDEARIAEVPRVYHVYINERFPPGYPLDENRIRKVYPTRVAVLKESLARWTARAYCALGDLGLGDEDARLLLQFYEQFSVSLIAENDEEFTIEVCGEQSSCVRGKPLVEGVEAPVYIEEPPNGDGRTEIIRIRLPSLYLQTSIEYYEHMIEDVEVYDDIPKLLGFYYSDMDDLLPARISIPGTSDDYPTGQPLLLREADRIWCLMVAQ